MLKIPRPEAGQKLENHISQGAELLKSTMAASDRELFWCCRTTVATEESSIPIQVTRREGVEIR
jgi:hypothetical protein